jgi:hypothetical protein
MQSFLGGIFFPGPCFPSLRRLSELISDGSHAFPGPAGVLAAAFFPAGIMDVPRFISFYKNFFRKGRTVMADSRQPETYCRSIFKSGGKRPDRNQFTQKWAELVRQAENDGRILTARR